MKNTCHSRPMGHIMKMKLFTRIPTKGHTIKMKLFTQIANIRVGEASLTSQLGAYEIVP